MAKKSKSKSSEATYDIERFIGHLPKSAQGPSDAESYLVKWEGYVVGEATWETAESLTETSKGAIKDYWKELKKNGGPPSEGEVKNDEDGKIKPDEIADHVANKLDAEKEQLSSEIVENAVVDENNEPEEYVIEEIRGTVPKTATKKEDTKKYIIKWEGYDKPEDITKEPANEIENSAPGKVKEFWKKRKQQQKALKAENIKKEVKKEAEAKKKEAKTKKNEEADAPVTAPDQSPGKRRSSRALKKIPEPAVKKIKMSPKKKNDAVEEKSSPEAETPSDESLNDIVYGLIKRVEQLETKPNTDRDFLKHLVKQKNLPRKIRNEISAHITNK